MEGMRPGEKRIHLKLELKSNGGTMQASHALEARPL